MKNDPACLLVIEGDDLPDLVGTPFLQEYESSGLDRRKHAVTHRGGAAEWRVHLHRDENDDQAASEEKADGSSQQLHVTDDG